MIYGEESKELKFGNGLWDTFVTPIPDDYCTRLVNLVPNKLGYVEMRGSFIGFGVRNSLVGSGNSSVVTTDPSLVGENYFQPFEEKLAHLSADYPNGLGMVDVNGIPLDQNRFYSSRYGSDPDVMRYNPTNSVQAGRGNCYCLVRDRLYIYTGAGIYRFTGWNFSTSAAGTETNIVGAPGAVGGTHLFFFKDRLWLITKDRIYYTDAAAVGSYPETWNTSSNFIDIPSDVAQFISGYAVLNNLLYFFTSGGVYTLQVLGTPTNWIFRRLNDTIRAYYPEAVCVNNGVVYYTDRRAIYAYNGYTQLEISAPVNALLSEYQGIGIFPFEDGLILSIQRQEAEEDPLNPGTYYAIVTEARNFYFNGFSWCEFTFPDNDNITVISSTPPRNISFFGYKPVSVLELFNWNGEFSDFCYYDDTNYEGDIFNGFRDSVDALLEVELFLGDLDENKRAKYGYLDFYCERERDIVIKTAVNGKAVGNTFTIDTSTLDASILDLNYVAKFPMPQYGRRFTIEISVVNETLETFTHTPIMFKGINLEFNTTRKVPDDDGG